MSKVIQIQAFQFLGGNRSELDKKSDGLAPSEWQEIVKKLASTVPNVFPTCPGPREIEQTKGLSFINVPMSELGMRVHTVYFAVNAAAGRAFFNVLSIAYHEETASLRDLAALSPADWWSICEQLMPGDTKITLPEKNTELDLPEWDGKKALFFRVPDFRGGVLNGEFEDWCETLNQASPPPYQSLPTPESKAFPLKNIVLIGLFAVAIASIIAGAVINSLTKSPAPDPTPVPTSKNESEEPQTGTEEPALESTQEPEQVEAQTTLEESETNIRRQQ